MPQNQSIQEQFFDAARKKMPVRVRNLVKKGALVDARTSDCAAQFDTALSLCCTIDSEAITYENMWEERRRQRAKALKTAKVLLSLGARKDAMLPYGYTARSQGISNGFIERGSPLDKLLAPN